MPKAKPDAARDPAVDGHWWQFRSLFRRNPKRRNCPVDWVDLVPHTVPVFGPDVKAERCPTCQGIYLDEGEVVRITGNVALDQLLTTDLGLDADSQRVCPGCGGVMDAEGAGGVLVDVCLTCKGVWVDHGELEGLKALTGKQARARSPEKKAELEKAKKARRAEAKQAAKDVADAVKAPFGKKR